MGGKKNRSCTGRVVLLDALGKGKGKNGNAEDISDTESVVNGVL